MTKYQIMPDLTDDEYQILKLDIAERGVAIPIELDEDGNILDGHHRVRAWRELKDGGNDLPDYPRVIRAGMDDVQKRNYVRAINVIRRQLTKEKRKELWAEMRKDGMTYQAIADVTGVSDITVRRAVKTNVGTVKLVTEDKTSTNNAEIQPSSVVGKDGKKYPAKKKKQKKKSTKPPQAPLVSVFTGSDEGEKKAKVKAKKVAETGKKGASQPVQVTIFSSESKEYYTPLEYIEAAREVMEKIDLDPASCEAAQERIVATACYTVEDDGLSKDWVGKIWLNPPYGKTGARSNQDIWAQYLISEYEKGNVEEAILLVRAALGYNWFENLWYDWTVCFVRERISFIKSDGSNDGKSKQGTVFLYLGPKDEKFRDVFGKFGRVIFPREGFYCGK